MTIKATAQQDIPALRCLWKQAFGDTDALLDAFFSTAYAPERSLCAYEDEKLVAMTYWVDCRWREHKIAYVYAVATDENYRGRGICHKLLQEAHKLLREQGYYGSLLVPANPGLQGFYQSMGYKIATTLRQLTLSAEGTPDLGLQKITWQEYRQLRPRFLPKESVLHGEEVYRYLDTYLDFYRADAGIFCGTVEDGDDGRCLRIQEFLGEEKSLLGVAVALRCQTVEVRLGGNTPFGLFYHLTKESAMPEYFGLPMD